MNRLLQFALALVFAFACLCGVLAAPMAGAADALVRKDGDAVDLPLLVRDATAIDSRDVWDPTIKVPNHKTVWHRGHTVTVKWETKDAPKNISNGSAIYLRKGDKTLVDHPLAKGFDLRKGSKSIKIPKSIKPGKDYRIVLFGDSGNWSVEFTIQ
ncbi:hypothetical protein BKA62DRAFT_423491 [Auriculariales sp. MPI-PUGE-AT-0066]|nr:hypothetical protein BKA62DRAFT_423491 [Auriculariales sp. MPI-PUGE-AT-0066]